MESNRCGERSAAQLAVPAVMSSPRVFQIFVIVIATLLAAAGPAAVKEDKEASGSSKPWRSRARRRTQALDSEEDRLIEEFRTNADADICMTTTGGFQGGYGNSFGYVNIALDYAVAKNYTYIFPPFMSSSVRFMDFGTHGALDHFQDFFESERVWWAVMLVMRRQNRVLPMVCEPTVVNGKSSTLKQNHFITNIGASFTSDLVESMLPNHGRRCDFFGEEDELRGLFHVPLRGSDGSLQLAQLDVLEERLRLLHAEERKKTTQGEDFEQNVWRAIATTLTMPFGSFGEKVPDRSEYDSPFMNALKPNSDAPTDILFAEKSRPAQDLPAPVREDSLFFNRTYLPCTTHHANECRARRPLDSSWFEMSEGELEEVSEILRICDVLLVASTDNTGYHFHWEGTVDLISIAYRDALEMRVEKAELHQQILSLVHISRAHLTHHFYAIQNNDGPGDLPVDVDIGREHWEGREHVLVVAIHYRLGDVKKCNLLTGSCSREWAAKHIGTPWPLFAVEVTQKALEKLNAEKNRDYMLEVVIVSDGDMEHDDELLLLRQLLVENHKLTVAMPTLDADDTLDVLANADVLVVGSSSFGVIATVLNTHVKFIMSMFTGGLPQGGARHTIEVPFDLGFYEPHGTNTDFVEWNVRQDAVEACYTHLSFLFEERGNRL